MQQGPRIAGEEERKDWDAAAPVGRVPSNRTKIWIFQQQNQQSTGGW